MSNKTLDKGIEYAGATGVLIPIVEELLISDDLSKEDVAKLLVSSIEDNGSYPDVLIRLKKKLKQKYNL